MNKAPALFPLICFASLFVFGFFIFFGQASIIGNPPPITSGHGKETQYVG
jgi:hypothetical protein